MIIPEKIYIYRLTHIENLDYILTKNKIICPNHPDAEKDYINIGDKSLIENRKEKVINLEPGGTFSDYVAFYFGARSPMLYEIQKGYNGVEKRDPEELIYLVSDFTTIKLLNIQYIFTDGHAYNHLSQFFNEEKDLKEIDWKAVNLVKWNDTEEDPDRKRRKQAEFLIHRELQFSAIIGIAVYNENAKSRVLSKFAEHELVL